MIKFILPLLVSFSANAANVCEAIGRCKICDRCDVHYKECVKKAKDDKYAINECDFRLAVCRNVNKCDEEQKK